MLLNADTKEIVKRLEKNCDLSNNTGKVDDTFAEDYFSGSIGIYSPQYYGTTIKINQILKNATLEDLLPVAKFENGLPVRMMTGLELTRAQLVGADAENVSVTYTLNNGKKQSMPEKLVLKIGTYTFTLIAEKNGLEAKASHTIEVLDSGYISIDKDNVDIKVGKNVEKTAVDFVNMLGDKLTINPSSIAQGAEWKIYCVVGTNTENFSEGVEQYSFGTVGDYTVTIGTTYNGFLLSDTFSVKVLEAYDETTVQWMRENNVTIEGETAIGANNTFTLTPSKSTYSAAAELLNNRYAHVRLNGTYPLGTLLEIEFTGKQMPYISFFEESTQGGSDISGKKGLLLSGGFYLDSHDGEYMPYTLWVYGPNMIGSDNLWGSVSRHNFAGAYPATDPASPFALKALQEGVKYRLTIGVTDGNQTSVKIYAKISSVSENGTETELGFLHKSMNLETEAEYYQGGSIGIYSPMHYGTTVKINGTYNYNDRPLVGDAETISWMKENNVETTGDLTIGANNTFTLTKAASVYKSADYTGASLRWNGNFGVGKILDISFKGKGMPYISFFENPNEKAGVITGKKGILLSGGYYYNGKDHIPYAWWTYGSSMMTANLEAYRLNLTDTYGSDPSPLALTSLDENVNYRLKIGIINVLYETTAPKTPFAYQFMIELYSVAEDGTETKIASVKPTVNLHTNGNGDSAFAAENKKFTEDYFNGGSIGIYAPMGYDAIIKINGVYDK